MKAIFSSILRKLEEDGHQDMSKWILIILVAAAMVYALVKAVLVLLQAKPEYTSLGRSICRQADQSGNFKDLCRDIDRDMEDGCKEFGADVFISSSWIFADDIMRLKRIKKIHTRKSTWMDYLVLEDVDGNFMEAGFLSEESAKEALEYLKSRLPLAEITDGEVSLGK